MIGGSSAPYLARTPCVHLFCTLLNRGGNRRAFRLPGEGGDLISIVRWNLRPVIFGVDISIAIVLQKYALLLAESSIYTTNLYHDTPPICIAILLQKY